MNHIIIKEIEKRNKIKKLKEEIAILEEQSAIHYQDWFDSEKGSFEEEEIYEKWIKVIEEQHLKLNELSELVRSLR